MPVVLRTHTFSTFPPNWLDHEGKPTMPFREYNEKIWEPWITQGYAQDKKPFTEGPETRFARQLDPLMAASREQITQAALGLLEDESNRHGDGLADEQRILRWLTMSKEKKEAVLLEIWRGGHELNERHDLGMWRAQAPDATLEDLVGKDGQGVGMIKLVLLCQPPPDFDIDTASIPVYHEDCFDRMWSIGKYEPVVPLSRAKRASIAYSVAARAYFLLSFVGLWKDKMDGGGAIRSAPYPPPCAVNSTTAPILFSTGRKWDVSCVRQQMAKNDVKRCQVCLHDEKTRPAIKLLCCGRCKSIGRMIWYCSVEHQKYDWNVHRRICGKVAGETAEEPGLPGK